jgi:hypothetical protein
VQCLWSTLAEKGPDNYDPPLLVIDMGSQQKPTGVSKDRKCTDCGTTVSSHWRKVMCRSNLNFCAFSKRPQGPNGAGTLCNACGERWRRKVKKAKARLSGMGETETET